MLQQINKFVFYAIKSKRTIINSYTFHKLTKIIQFVVLSMAVTISRKHI